MSTAEPANVAHSRNSRQTLDFQAIILRKLDSVVQASSTQSKTLDDDTTDSLDISNGIGAEILRSIITAAELANNEEDLQQIRSDWTNRIIGALFTERAEACQTHVVPQLSEERQLDLQRLVLKSLHFPLIDDRSKRVSDAHKATFEWVFDQNLAEDQHWSSLPQWLASSSSLYWITGKPGSGKSTLMKYICTPADSSTEIIALDNAEQALQSRCVPMLKPWVDTSKLIIGVFYFWCSGTEALQRSQQGLFRTLLHQILTQCPSMIPHAFSRRWDALSLFNKPRLPSWSDQELVQGLYALIQRLGHEHKICLFIDGLDEFDGDHKYLVSTVKELSSYSNVKICTSSRPWEIFESAFNSAPSLMVHNLTRKDIRAYTSAQLLTDSSYTNLQAREPVYANNLVDSVVTKANGVFLWVKIAVASLLGGIMHGDRIVDLERRLQELPTELKHLYERILVALDPFYLGHAAELFQLVEKSTMAPAVLLVSYADEKADRILTREVDAITLTEFQLRYETTRRRLNSRCKGLLEMPRLSTSTTRGFFTPATAKDLTVQYLHRTVKDYLDTQEVRAKLDAALNKGFDPHLSLLVGNLALLKTIRIDIEQLQSADSYLWGAISQCMTHAARVRQENSGIMVALLDDLDRTLRLVMKKLARETPEANLPESHWQLETGQWAALDPSMSFKFFGTHFLSLVVRHGIVPYATLRCSSRGLVQRDRNFKPGRLPPSSGTTAFYPLLIDALYIPRTLTEAASTAERTLEHRQRKLEMLECLLDKRARFDFEWPYQVEGDALGSSEGVLGVGRIKTQQMKLTPWDVLLSQLGLQEPEITDPGEPFFFLAAGMALSRGQPLPEPKDFPYHFLQPGVDQFVVKEYLNLLRMAQDLHVPGTEFLVSVKKAWPRWYKSSDIRMLQERIRHPRRLRVLI